MKKLLLFTFLGLLTLAFVAGCKKDQAKVNEKAIANLLIGKWINISVQSGNITDGVVFDNGISDYRGTGQYMQFTNDGQGSSDESIGNILSTPFTYSLKDTVLTVNYVKATAPDGVRFDDRTKVFYVHTIDDFNLTLNNRTDITLNNGKIVTFYETAKFQK